MPRRLPAIVLLPLVAAIGVAHAVGPAAFPSAATLAADVAVLAAPALEGRGSGTPGGDRAARILSDWLAAAGLRPGGDAGTFLQSFTLSTTVALAPGNIVEVMGGTALAAEQDFMPHGGSTTAEVVGPLMFAGYGLASPVHDDYAGLNVNGAVVMVLEGQPRHLGDPAPSRPEKLVTARQRGARAVLVVSDRLPPVRATPTATGIVSLAVTPSAASRLLAPSGTSVAGLVERIDATRAPASFAVGGEARVRVALKSDVVRAANVIGVLPGTDPTLAGEAVVVGAHYDHLGVVEGVVHPGADDNASGTAVVIGLARAFAAAGGTSRTLVFVLFAGEELGLLGSAHYVRHPVVPLARTVAMLNFDMVGRLRAGTLSIGGIESAPELRAVVTDAARAEGVTPGLRGSPYGPSDHASFYRAGTPVIFFHTGTHEHYHRPGDTADTIDAAGMARVAAVGVRITAALAGAGPRPVYAAVAPPARGSGAAGPGTAFLGVSVHPEGDGVRLTSVQPGSAAARAGIRGGDVLLRVAGTSVASLQELRALLAARRPGDRVEMFFLRDGETQTGSTTLDARP